MNRKYRKCGGGRGGLAANKPLKALWDSIRKTKPSTFRILSSTVMTFQNCRAVYCEVLQECILPCPRIPLFYLPLCPHSEQITKEAVTLPENNIGAQSVSSSPLTKRVSVIPKSILSNILVYVPGK